jgi:hypothetical protein
MKQIDKLQKLLLKKVAEGGPQAMAFGTPYI